MKGFFLIIFNLLFFFKGNCQIIDSLIERKQSMLSKVKLLQDSIKMIEKKIENELNKAAYQVNEDTILTVVLKEDSPLKSLPILTAKNIGFIYKNDTVRVYSRIYESYDIYYLKCVDSGYVYLHYLTKTDELLALEKRFKNQKDSIQPKGNEDLTKSAEFKKKLIAAFGVANTNKILEKKIWLGMTANMATYSWGRPLKVNSSVGSFGKHEQWVYPNGVYLYFENDILTSWQD